MHFILYPLRVRFGAFDTSLKSERILEILCTYSDIMAAFRDSAYAKRMPKDAMTVHVLTTGFWPPYPPIGVALPSQLTQYQDVFTV